MTSDGTVFELGNLPYCGGLNTSVLPSQVVSMASTPGGGGYWLLLGDGSVYAFGNATWYGDLRGSAWRGGPVPPGAPVVGIAASPDGKGYFVVAADGSVYAFGDARYHGSRGGRRTDGAVVAMAVDPVTGGYWLVTSKGAVYGEDAPNYGTASKHALASPIVGIAVAPDGKGYALGYPRWRRLRVRIGVTRSDGARASRCVSRRNRRESLGQGLLAGDGIGDDHLLGQERLLR